MGSLNIYSIYTSTANIIDTIIVQAIPVFGDTGINVLTLTATDTINHLRSTVTYTIDVTTACLPGGIAEVNGNNDFSVYPNPAGKSLTIHYDDNTGSAEVKIFEVQGTEVLSSGPIADKSEIDVSRLARGMYFVELFKDGVALSVEKIILL